MDNRFSLEQAIKLTDEILEMLEEGELGRVNELEIQRKPFIEQAFRGSVEEIDVIRALVIGVTTDILFPSRQQREIAEVMAATGTKVDYVEIDSVNGHDAFLIDDEHFSPVVKKFLDLTRD